jgi:hypothetical protein
LGDQFDFGDVAQIGTIDEDVCTARAPPGCQALACRMIDRDPFWLAQVVINRYAVRQGESVLGLDVEHQVHARPQGPWV